MILLFSYFYSLACVVRHQQHHLIYQLIFFFLPSVTSFGFVFLFHLGFFQTVYFVLYVVFIDFLLAGVISASVMWLLSNKFMREPNSENIEWGYSFDVHINATFPPLIILHFFMLLFYKVLFSQEWLVARILGNLLWLLATSYYIYITFLGYNCKCWVIIINFLLSQLSKL